MSVIVPQFGRQLNLLFDSFLLFFAFYGLGIFRMASSHSSMERPLVSSERCSSKSDVRSRSSVRAVSLRRSSASSSSIPRTFSLSSSSCACNSTEAEYRFGLDKSPLPPFSGASIAVYSCETARELSRNRLQSHAMKKIPQIPTAAPETSRRTSLTCAPL